VPPSPSTRTTCHQFTCRRQAAPAQQHLQPHAQRAACCGGTPAPGFGGPRSPLGERQGGQHGLHAPTAQAKPSYAPCAGASGTWVYSPSSEPALGHTRTASWGHPALYTCQALCPAVAAARAPQPCILHDLVSLVAIRHASAFHTDTYWGVLLALLLHLLRSLLYTAA
jgi:hypothetical protein